MGREVGGGREEREVRDTVYIMVFVYSYSYWGTGTISPYCKGML